MEKITPEVVSLTALGIGVFLLICAMAISSMLYGRKSVVVICELYGIVTVARLTLAGDIEMAMGKSIVLLLALAAVLSLSKLEREKRKELGQ